MRYYRIQRLTLFLTALFLVLVASADASAPIISQLKDQHADTLLVAENFASVVIVTPASGRYDSSVNLIRSALETRINAVVTVHPDTVDPETILSTVNVIALGNSTTNIFIKKLYRQWYTLLDLTYPGTGGYVVRSLHDPYGTAHNIIFAGGSDDNGVLAAANVLASLINTGSGNAIGRLMDISLGSAFTNLPIVGTDIGANIAAPDWKVFTWRDSYRILSGGGNTGYAPATYFGWNPISIAGVLYYMTGDIAYLDLFKQLAIPDQLHMPIANQTSPAFNLPDDPLVDNYHYLSHLVDIIYDLIEDSPELYDTEQLHITNKLIEHQFHYDSTNTYGSDNGSRHIFWHLFNIYTGSRYLEKYYPNEPITGHTWTDRINKVRNHFNSVINNPTWGERDTLEWVNTSTEVLFDFFMMDGFDTFVSSGTAKSYIDAIEIMYTGAEKDDSSRYLTLNLLHKAADMLDDGRYIWLRDQLAYDLQTPRIGQSYSPSPTLPVLPPTDLSNTVTVYSLALYDWNTSNSELPAYKQIPLSEGFQLLSYRNGLGANDDFIQLDGYFGAGRNTYHTNTLSKLRMFNGALLLDGYQNDVDITVNGLVNTLIPRSTALKNVHATNELAYLHTETPGMTDSVWARHVLYLRDQATIVIDNVTAETSGEFNITLSWELGSTITGTTDDAQVVTTNNSVLVLANGLDVEATGKVVRQELASYFSAGEEVAIGNILSSPANQWTIKHVEGQNNAFLVSDSTVNQGLVVIGNMTTPDFSIMAEFAYFDDQKAVLSKAASFIVDGQEQITSPQDILVLAVDMSAAISHVSTVPPAPVPVRLQQKLNWNIDQEVQLLAGITNVKLTENLPDGTLWVIGTGLTDFQIMQLSQSDLSIQGDIIHSSVEPTSLWLAENSTQASAFSLLAGFKDDALSAYDNQHNPIWNITAQIDPSFIDNNDPANPVYLAPWFTDPERQSGIFSILVDDLWGAGEEVVLGRPSTLEFHDMYGNLLKRLPVQWGNVSSLSLLRTSPYPLNNLVLAGKNYTGNPQITTVNNPGGYLGNTEFASLKSGHTSMHAWLQRGMNHMAVADINNDGTEEVIYTLSGHWNELRVYDGPGANLKWARYFGPAESLGDYMRDMQIADLDGDGNAEIVIGTRDGWLYVFDNQGNQLWNKGYSAAVTKLATVIVGSTRQLVAGFEDGLILTLDHNGNQQLTGQLVGAIDAIAVAGTQVFCGTRTGILARMDSTAAPGIRVPPANRPREVARWALDETEGLSAGNEINPFEVGTLVNGPVWAPTEGNGGALDFTENDTRVVVPHYQTQMFDKQVSVAAWIKVPQPGANFEIFLTQNDTSEGTWNGFYLGVETDGRLSLFSNATVSPWLYTAAAIDINNWVHVVMTIDESEARFYLNGELSSAVPTKSGYTITNTYDLIMGSNINGANSFSGLMDDVRFFNYALSEQEATDTYALASHWPLDEVAGTDAPNLISATDAGTLVNNPTWLPQNGINGALGFNTGIDHSHVSVADSATFDFPGQISASAWIYIDEYPASTFNIFLSKMDYAGGNWHGFYLDIQQDGKLRLVSNAAGNVLKTGSPVPLNQWVHVGATIDINSDTILYINGVPAATETTNPALIINNSKVLTIGAYQQTGNDFNGFVDEVRIYDRSLTGHQISGIYSFELSKNTDSDNDDLTDYEEQCFDWACNTYNPYHPVTNPVGTDLDFATNDTDQDGFTDSAEIQSESDPLDPLSIPFVMPSGDINMDGFVNAADILLVTRHILGLAQLSPLQIDNGDLYPGGGGDGLITTSDLLLLYRTVLQ